MSKILAESRPLNSVDLFITERCNLNCTYCFHNQSASDLTFESGKQILGRLKLAAPEHLTITFFGGEPMLQYQLILDLAEYARSLWPSVEGKAQVAFNLSTNGTIFNEDFFRKFNLLGGKVQISLDGDKETSEATRVGINFEETVHNIQKLLEIAPNTNCRLTFTPETVGKLSTNILFLHNLGFNSIMHQAVIEAKWTEEAVKQYEYQLRQLYAYRRHVLRNNGKLELHFVERALKLLNGEIAKEDNYCEAGQTYLAILPNGDVHTCHRSASARKFKLGNILSDVMPIIRGTFLNLNKNTSGCSKNCASSGTCHTCHFMHYQVNGNVNLPVFSYCQLCYVEDKIAKEYLQTEINDRLERKLDKVADIFSHMDSELDKIKDCLAGLLQLSKKEDNV